MSTTEHTETGTTFAITEGPPSEAVVRAVATVEDVGPTALPPLFTVLDPDALDTLVRGQSPVTVTFEYSNYTVTVRENAEIIVRERSAPAQ